MCTLPSHPIRSRLIALFVCVALTASSTYGAPGVSPAGTIAVRTENDQTSSDARIDEGTRRFLQTHPHGRQLSGALETFKSSMSRADGLEGIAKFFGTLAGIGAGALLTDLAATLPMIVAAGPLAGPAILVTALVGMGVGGYYLGKYLGKGWARPYQEKAVADMRADREGIERDLAKGVKGRSHIGREELFDDLSRSIVNNTGPAH